MTKSLWGDLPKGDPIKGPKDILREQAQILDDQTNHVIHADVRTSVGGDISHYFYLVAPFLNNYRTLFLSVTHGLLSVYPAILYFDDQENKKADPAVKCRDEAEFITQLGAVLSSPSAHRLIGAIISQSKSI